MLKTTRRKKILSEENNTDGVVMAEEEAVAVESAGDEEDVEEDFGIFEVELTSMPLSGSLTESKSEINCNNVLCPKVTDIWTQINACMTCRRWLL